MEIPANLMKVVDKKYRERLTQERRKRTEERARQTAEKAARRKRLEEGLSFAKFIFDWADQFRKNKKGRRLIKLCSWTYLGGVMFFDEDLPKKAWRGLGVSLEGVWWIRNGCGAYPEIVESPKELAVEIDTEILAAACESIKNGKVWDCIKNRWELKNQ